VKVVGVKIIDPAVDDAVRKKKLTGMSVAGVVTEAICSLCASQYVTCDHIATQWYGRSRCTVRITQFRLAEISLVADPINPSARIIY
jgi:hypothetical protein